MAENDTNRLEAFSDGVFAVAITLLVLNIQPPSLSTPELLTDPALRVFVGKQWPILLASVTSFFTIGIMWITPLHR